MWIISNLGLLEIKLNEYSHTCLPMVEFTSEAMWVSSFLHKKVFNKRFNFFSDRAIEVISSNLFFYFVSNLLFF